MGGGQEDEILDKEAATVMVVKFAEVGATVEAGEILKAVEALREGMQEQRASGGGLGRCGRFALRREFGGAGIVQSTVGEERMISMEVFGADKKRIVQTLRRSEGDGWELHDTPAGGAARTHLILTGDEKAAYIWREGRYSYGRRWDPTPGVAAETFYYEDGRVRCQQHFIQGAARGANGGPVFEGFRKDGSSVVVEYGDSRWGKHRPVEEGPAYQETHPNGNPAVVVFAIKGRQRGKTLRYGADGSGPHSAPPVSQIQCDTLTNAESWAESSRNAELQNKPSVMAFGEALSAAIHSQTKTWRRGGGRGRRASQGGR